MVCLKIMQSKTSFYAEYITKTRYMYGIVHQRCVQVAIKCKNKLMHM